MTIKYSIKKYKYPDLDKVVDNFNIEEPHRELMIICSVYYNVQDMELFIECIEDLIASNIPDYSSEGGIEYQAILFGSKKSKIAEYVDGKIVGGQEFDTQKFLDVCYAWRDFLKERT